MDSTSFQIDQKETGFEPKIQEIWKKEGVLSILSALTAQAGLVQEELLKKGEMSFEALQHASGREPALLLSDFITNYVWPEDAKAFMILWRDILFNLSKALILKADGRIREEQLNQLSESSFSTLQGAARDLREVIGKEVSSMKKSGKTAQQIERWKLQNNPWLTYSKQLALLPEQCQLILRNVQDLLIVNDIFTQVKRLMHQFLDNCTQEIEEISNSIQQMIEDEEWDNTEDHNVAGVIAKLEDLESQARRRNYFKLFVRSLEIRTQALPEKKNVAIDIDGGILQTNEIEFQRKTRQWLDAEVIPMLNEVWSWLENIRNRFKLTLLNIRNWANLLVAELKEGKIVEFKKADLFQPLEEFLVETQKTNTEISKMRAELDQMADDHLQVSNVYQGNPNFLPIPIQTTINQFRISQFKVLSDLQIRFSGIIKNLKDFQRSVEQEEALSISEKVVRLIQSRQTDEANQNYASVFQAKGFIGDAFSVGRKDETLHIGNIIRNWKKGFRGAVLITGQRFSGKTQFGEMISHKFFPHHTISLAPGSTIEVQGRKLDVTYDLGKAVGFITKYALNTFPLIWIDDLELWWDPHIPLHENVKALTKYIDSYADRYFFMVSMNYALQAQLERVYEIDKVFQAEINMEKLELSEIREAILIRHGATHKKLVSTGKTELTPMEFNRISRAVFRYAKGNIGDALKIWGSFTTKVDEKHVKIKLPPNYQLPEFLTPDSAILLRSIVLQKLTTEYRLRKLFGPAFNQKYLQILRRFLSVGIVVRQLDDWIKINPALANDLGSMLEKEGYLKYSK